MKKRILFVINTMGGAGAETALLGLMERLDKSFFDVSLYVLLEQGELIDRLPEGVRLVNRRYSSYDVFSPAGRRRMYLTSARLWFTRLSGIIRLPYTVRNLVQMIKKRRVLPDKLMWRIAADGAYRSDSRYDLAVAYIEGGSAYYVSDHVNAGKKAAFIHVDYEMAGYTRKLDLDCYKNFDRIFTVSGEVRDSFVRVYPEYAEKTRIFHNIIDPVRIREKSLEKIEFDDLYDGFRILTVGRLTEQKSYDIAVRAMKLIKERGIKARWYVLGEGNMRRQLERLIEEFGLEEDFILCGAVSNPFPYYKRADLYVHATRFEGKSIAVQEAQILGCAVLASDCSGNREQVTNGIDGWLCCLSPEKIAEKIIYLAGNADEIEKCKKEVEKKSFDNGDELDQLLELSF